jgi:hypothetical protein
LSPFGDVREWRRSSSFDYHKALSRHFLRYEDDLDDSTCSSCISGDDHDVDHRHSGPIRALHDFGDMRQGRVDVHASGFHDVCRTQTQTRHRSATLERCTSFPLNVKRSLPVIIRWLSHPGFVEPPEISPLEDDRIVPGIIQITGAAWPEELVEGRCYAEWYNKVVREQVMHSSPVSHVKRRMTVVDQSLSKEPKGRNRTRLQIMIRRRMLDYFSNGAVNI